MRITKVKQKAALLVADGRHYTDIATECKVSLSCLTKWRAAPEFDAMVQEHRKGWAQQLYTTGIANRQSRLLRMNNRWDRGEQLIDQRGRDPRMKDVPGGDTGLILRKLKTVGGQPVAEYVPDTALMAEMRATEAAAEKETRQCPSPAEETGAGEAPEGQLDLSLLTDKQFDLMRELALLATPKEKKAA